MFTQRGRLQSLMGEYQLRFDVDTLEPDDGVRLPLDIEISPDGGELEFSSVVFSPHEAHAVNPSVLDADTDGIFEHSLEIVAESERTVLGFDIVPWATSQGGDEERAESTFVDLPSLDKIRLCKRVCSAGLDPETRDELTTIYGDDESAWWLRFRTDARRVLSFDRLVELMATCASQEPDVAAHFEEHRDEFFKEMIVGVDGAQYHPIQSYEELEDRCNLYKEYDELEPVAPEEPLRLALRELEENSRYKKLNDVISELRVLHQHPELLEEHLSEFHMAKSSLLEAEPSRSVIETLASDSDLEDYDEAKSTALTGGESAEETASMWRDLLAPALGVSSTETPFVAGRYLHWKARAYADSDQHLELTPVLFDGAAALSSAAGDEEYAQLSQYYHNLQTGFRELDEGNPTSAAKAFTEAGEVASNEQNSWSEQRIDLAVRALQYKTIAEVSGGPIEYDPQNTESLSVDIQEVDSEELNTKLSLINDRIEVLEDPDFPEGTADRAIDTLRAKQWELLANERISTGHYNLAIEAIDEVIRLYNQLNEAAEAHRAIGFKQHISAVLAETQANFDAAANNYESVARQDEYVTSSWQNQELETRAVICRAKSALLDDDLDAANRILEDSDASVERSNNEAGDLKLLIELLQDFDAAERTPIGDALQQLSADSPDEDRSLSVTFDYKPAVTAVLSAQRLKVAGVDDGLLRRFIKVGIAESFTPDSSEKVVSDTGLSEISVDTVWRTHLPIYTHRNLERIEIKENSVTTGDYSDIASKLFSTFEKYLEVLVEYYVRADGYAWRDSVTDTPEKDLSLGHLARFFQADQFSESSLQCRRQVARTMDEEVIRGKRLVNIRNELDHGHIDSLSEGEYENIKSAVVRILEDTAIEAPIIFQPKSRNTFGSKQIYSCELFWSHTQKQASIETEASLDLDNVYFMSPDCRSKLGDRDIVEIDADDIVQATERRIRDAIRREETISTSHQQHH